jgi:hypothetical protein
LHGYHDANKKFPAGAQEAVLPVPNPTNTTTTILGTTWIVFILPYIEQGNVHARYDFTQKYDSVANGLVGEAVIPVLYCPSGPAALRVLDPNTNLTKNPSTHYYGVMGPSGATNPSTYTVNGIKYSTPVGNPLTNGAYGTLGILSRYTDSTGSVTTGRLVKITEITDGTSNTIMIGERCMFPHPSATNEYRSWIRGNNGGAGACKNVLYPINSTFYNGSTNFNDISFGSPHAGGCFFAMADGTVRFVDQAIDLGVLQATSTINMGELASIE